MKKKFYFVSVLSAVFVASLTSCSGAGVWNECGTSLEVNYCLLQGQMDHNDSIERTRGTRDALGTRANNDDSLNENVQKPKVNNNFKVRLKDAESDIDIKVREIEHATMISTAGATWDSITANDTSTIWLNKHSADRWSDLNRKSKQGQSITMFVSNNDGMSMGALGSVMWPKGMPIFGFDANDSSLVAIRNKKMTGTIDCNPIAQVAACLMMIRNITDWKEEIPTPGGTYSRYSDEVAFANISGPVEDENLPYYNKPFGYIKKENILETKESRAWLSQGVPVTRKEGVELQRLNSYFNSDGSVKTTVERIYDAEPNLTKTRPESITNRNLFMTYNNQTDTFFSATIRPLFNKLKDLFGVDIDDFSGNGNDEAGCLDAFSTAVNKDGYDAFIINMVKSSNGQEYINKLLTSNYYDKVSKKITVPVIFWNKQPTDVNGNVDIKFMHQDCFSFVCYVGIDSYNSGQDQGKMVAQWVKDQYAGIKY